MRTDDRRPDGETRFSVLASDGVLTSPRTRTPVASTSADAANSTPTVEDPALEVGPPADLRNYAHNAAPFLVAVVLCAASPALSQTRASDGFWWLAAAGFLILMLVIGAVATRGRPGNWLYTAAPLVLLPAVQALRAANGDARSGFLPMLFLPTIWFALYGRLRDVFLSILGAILVVTIPVLVVGAPRYPAANWRLSTLLILMLATVGLLVHRLVSSAQAQAVTADINAARLGAVFDDAPVGMALSHEHVQPGSSFLLVNKALCAMLGRDAEELVMLPLDTICHPEDLASFSCDADADRSAGFEARLRHRTGRVVWVAISRVKIHDLPNQPAQLAWQIHDITDRQETDSALLNALNVERHAVERLRDFDQARAELVSSISHDLRTPMTAARGYAELLAEGTFGTLTHEQSAAASTIARSLIRLSTIIDGLVSAPIGTDNDCLSMHSVDLNVVLTDAVKMIAIQAAQRHQVLTVTNTLQAAWVRGDVVRLGRALVNLLGNAVKYTPDGGSVCLDARADGADAVISISDSGAGIAPEEQARIFERYYRAPRDGLDEVPGSGLGLAIVKSITTQHGGTITVSSGPGSGSVFVLRLPLS